MRAILTRLEPAALIGLGEQTHGSEENARVRAELVRRMVEQLDVRVVALEADYAEVLKIDAFVQGGPGDATAILGKQRAGWIWDKPALRSLLLWLREVNAKRPEGERVHVVGVDMQTAVAIVSSIDAQLERIGKQEPLRKKLVDVYSCNDPKLDPELKVALDALAPKTPELAPLLRSLEQCKLAAAEGLAGEQARERGMADNLIALVDAKSPSPRRVVVLAHNAHVSNDPLGTSKADPMGRLLRQHLGAKYFAVGSVIGDGEFRAYRFDPGTGNSKTPELLSLGAAAPGTVEATLSDEKAFFLPLRSSASEKWYDEERPMRIIGASYAPAYGDHYLHSVRVGVAFDALVYLPHA